MKSRKVGRPTKLAVLLVFLFAWPCSANAQSPAALMDQGIELYNQLRFNDSVKKLNLAAKLQPTPEILGKINLYLGLNYGVMGKQHQVEEAFVSALTNDPTLTLDPEQVKPELVAIFQSARMRLKGDMEINSEHAGARVLLDGAQIGHTPLRTTVIIGQHRLQVLSPDGNEHYEIKVVVGAGKTIVVKAQMSKAPSKLTVRSNFSGARVWFDGRELGTTPLEQADVEAGTHELKVQGMDYEESMQTITLNAGQHQIVDVKLIKKSSDSHLAHTLKGLRFTYVTAGGAVVSTIVAIGLGISVLGTRDDFRATPAYETERLDDLENSLNSKALGANVMWTMAGAFTAATVGLFFWEKRNLEKNSAALSSKWQIQPVLTNAANGLIIGRRF